MKPHILAIALVAASSAACAQTQSPLTALFAAEANSSGVWFPRSLPPLDARSLQRAATMFVRA